MRKSVFILFTAFLAHSCATLDVNEIMNLDKQSFEPFELKPAVDVNMIRIDIKREKSRERDFVDSIVKTEDVRYEPFGFDLGNDLFFDLNNNLGIRIDELFNVENKYFEVETITLPKRNKGVYTQQFFNDTIRGKTPFMKKQKYECHKVQNGDTLTVMRKKQVLFTVIENDTSFVYKRRWAGKDILYEIDDRSYFLNRNSKRFTYRLSGDTLYLGKWYILVRTRGGRSLELRRNGKKRSGLLYRIEKSDNKIFIYDKYFCGTKLEIKGDTLFQYSNDHLYRKFLIILK